MRIDVSIRTRLVLGAAVVLMAFIAVAGLAVQRAHTDSVLAAHYARLQGTIYLLLAGADIDENGALVMPAALAEPRLSLPGSGLYASILNVNRKDEWRSGSAVGIDPPFERNLAVGEWKYETLAGARGAYLAVAYGVRWAGPKVEVPLALSVLEQKSEFDRELKAFQRTLWSWLGGAGLLLLLSQTLLLQWGLAPLHRVADEIARIEHGEQTEVQGHYPREIRAMTGNLNTLIKQERVRQTRYKEALSYLAHSLKTPLAVLRNALAEPAQLPGAVSQQVSRMDQIVQHQLTRAAASGAARFAPYLPLAPVLHRIRDSLAKVYADKGLAFEFDCAADLRWRIDEGDAFEMLGNLLDNAAKWAKRRIAVKLWRDSAGLRIRIEDDGPGFSDTQSILQLHVRADEQVPGHGVGLAVVNDLVASHEGQLILSRSKLGGAQVEILLPAA
ncbi:MAG: periplasmic sensor signal transduction histidine kinase [Ramlibacter sp.]|jgi:two-component system sensor histidine kinase PhoQ|nr:periplasmic sensor signal transduction histidine kinase [Ramlibacter sp.]